MLPGRHHRKRYLVATSAPCFQSIAARFLSLKCEARARPIFTLGESTAAKRDWLDPRFPASGIPASKTEVILRVSLADKREFHALLTADKNEFQIPERQDAWQVFVDYIKLGFEHILSGADHLAFVLGLLLLVSRSTIFWTITAFTLGHSITLALSAMRIVEVSQRPVEILIAASIALVAWEIVRTQQSDPARKPSSVPIWMAAGFGLLHGLGFAGALREVGLPQGEIPTALLAFNIGIELGQLTFVAVALIPLTLLSRSTIWSRRVRVFLAYVIGSLAFYWVFERIAGY